MGPNFDDDVSIPCHMQIRVVILCLGNRQNPLEKVQVCREIENAPFPPQTFAVSGRKPPGHCTQKFSDLLWRQRRRAAAAWNTSRIRQFAAGRHGSAPVKSGNLSGKASMGYCRKSTAHRRNRQSLSRLPTILKIASGPAGCSDFADPMDYIRLTDFPS